MSDDSTLDRQVAAPDMTAEEFQSSGLLQEVNRQWFHPRGLALSVVVHADGTKQFGNVLDARDDYEGFVFSEGGLAGPAATAAVAAPVKGVARRESLGWIVQPVGTS